MNKRYMELDKQASDYYWSLDDSERKAEAYTKKFAELIVKECAEICLEANDHKNILRHFGVEE